MEMLKEKRYTYDDYRLWPDDVRYELIDGVAYMMSAPSPKHQGISRELTGQLWQFLKGKPCQVFAAPFDVRLNAAEGDDTVVQPDITVICDRTKIGRNACNGVPDMVVEILSPSSESYDMVLKFNRYLRAGVREYWLIHPDSKTLTVHILKDGEYMARAYSNTDTVSVHVLDGCQIDMNDVFEE